MNYNLEEMATFGVAGNFTGHLEQAGEAKDFTNIKTKEENAPKAIFPTYIPSKNILIPEFLKTFPFDSEKIIFPKNEEKTGGILGAGLGILLDAAAAGTESFEKSLSEEIEKSDDSDGEEEAE